ncbi:MAG: Gfo/Idh/MocA family oxidoreductase [Ruminococcaceae bacterium]|nr:Gfo/Idh/MocA family oxidoreductase [Oscillospiraceae bacterium]
MSDAVLSQFKQAEKEEKKVESGRKLRIGIIGTGGIAAAHMGHYLEHEDCEVVAGCDLIPGKAQKFMEERFEYFGANYYTDYKEMIAKENLDGVSICTYNAQHAEPAIYCLEHDIPVLLEKPFTVTLEEAEDVCRAEKKSKAFVSVGFQPRFNDNMKMIKKIVESGTLGKIYYIQTGGGRRRGIPGNTFIRKETAGIGALADIGCYSLDMVLNAIGNPKPLTVTGYVSDFFGKDPKYSRDPVNFSVDDFGAAFIRLEGGIILDFRISWAMHADSPGDTIIFGTEGALRIPATDCWNGSVGGPMTIYHDLCGQRTETVVPLLEDCDCFDFKIRTFLDAIKTGGPAPIPTSQIIYNQAIIDGIVKSAELKKEVEIKFSEDIL